MAFKLQIAGQPCVVCQETLSRQIKAIEKREIQKEETDLHIVRTLLNTGKVTSKKLIPILACPVCDGGLIK